MPDNRTEAALRAAADIAERATQERDKQARLAGLTVSIDVTVGGYTGQRDDWEEGVGPYKVKLHGDTIALSDHTGIPGRQIRFSREGLEAAIKILEDYGA